MRYGCVFHCFLRPIRWFAIKFAVMMTVQLHSFIGAGLDCQPSGAVAASGLRTVRIRDDHSGLCVFIVRMSTAIALI